MPALRPTPAPVFSELLTGFFRRGPSYAAWRPGGTTDWLLIGTVSGAGRFGHAAGELRTAPGDLVLLAPGTPHDYGAHPAARRWDLLWVHFHPRPHWIDLLDWPAEAPGLMRLSLPARARPRFRRRLSDVHRHAQSAERRATMLAMNALEEVLLWCDQLNPLAAAAPGLDQRIRHVMNEVCRSLEQQHTLATMADLAGLSPSRFAHLFRLATATTPQAFIERQRLSRARTLLGMTGLSIKQIARQVGYESPFYFTNRYRKCFGQSPRETRRIAGGAGPAGH